MQNNFWLKKTFKSRKGTRIHHASIKAPVPFVLRWTTNCCTGENFFRKEDHHCCPPKSLLDRAIMSSEYLALASRSFFWNLLKRYRSLLASFFFIQFPVSLSAAASMPKVSCRPPRVSLQIVYGCSSCSASLLLRAMALFARRPFHWQLWALASRIMS